MWYGEYLKCPLYYQCAMLRIQKYKGSIKKNMELFHTFVLLPNPPYFWQKYGIFFFVLKVWKNKMPLCPPPKKNLIKDYKNIFLICTSLWACWGTFRSPKIIWCDWGPCRFLKQIGHHWGNIYIKIITRLWVVTEHSQMWQMKGIAI